MSARNETKVRALEDEIEGLLDSLRRRDDRVATLEVEVTEQRRRAAVSEACLDEVRRMQDDERGRSPKRRRREGDFAPEYCGRRSLEYRRRYDDDGFGGRGCGHGGMAV